MGKSQWLCWFVGKNDLIPYPYTGYQAPGMPFFEQAYF